MFAVGLTVGLTDLACLPVQCAVGLTVGLTDFNGLTVGLRNLTRNRAYGKSGIFPTIAQTHMWVLHLFHPLI